jgi:transposase
VRPRRRWTIEEKRRIAEETFLPGASVAQIAQRYALNANQLFTWRRLYRQGQLGNTATKLLPVTTTEERRVEVAKVVESTPVSPSGAIEIKLTQGSLYLSGRVDLMVLRTALECLLG